MSLVFLRPEWLWGLLGLPLLVLWWRRRRQRDDAWRTVVDPHLLPHLLGARSRRGGSGLVALLIGFHAWMGHHIVKLGETDGRHDPPEPGTPLLLLLVPVLVILLLVLWKPDLGDITLPGWLTEPHGRQLPVSDVPR